MKKHEVFLGAGAVVALEGLAEERNVLEERHAVAQPLVGGFLDAADGERVAGIDLQRGIVNARGGDGIEIPLDGLLADDARDGDGDVELHEPSVIVLGRTLMIVPMGR